MDILGTLQQYDTAWYKIRIGTSLTHDRDVYQVINVETDVIEAETPVLPQARKMALELTEHMSMPEEIIQLPPKQDIIVA